MESVAEPSLSAKEFVPLSGEAARSLLRVEDALHEIECEIAAVQEAVLQLVTDEGARAGTGAQLILSRNTHRLRDAANCLEEIRKTGRADPIP